MEARPFSHLSQLPPPQSGGGGRHPSSSSFARVLFNSSLFSRQNCPFMGARSIRLSTRRPLHMASAGGRRRALRALVQWYDDDFDRQKREETIPEPPKPPLLFGKMTEPTAVEPPWVANQPEPPDWAGNIVPAYVEKNANRLVGLPLSLRLIKEKLKSQRRLPEGSASDVYGWRSPAHRAFSTMVFVIRELHVYAVQLRVALFGEGIDVQGILEKTQDELNSSFVWLFQQVFSGTPALMVSLMLFLADFAVFSLAHNANTAAAASAALAQPALANVHDYPRCYQKQPDGLSQLDFRRRATSDEGGGMKNAAAAAFADDGGLGWEEVEAWDAIVEEADRIKASTRDEALMDLAIVQSLVAPVTTSEAEAEEEEEEVSSEHFKTMLRYEAAILDDPYNALLLANFAQFLSLFVRDHDRAEFYFKKAVEVAMPADPDALCCYAKFLWKVRKNLEAAEEAYLEAIAGDPSNPAYAAEYASFLWNTGGADTCYPLD